jgi:hypothetical protein
MGMPSRSDLPQHGRRSAVRAVALPARRRRVALDVGTGRSLQNRLAIGVTVLAMVASLSIAPTDRAEADASFGPEQHVASQTLAVDANVAAPAISRDELGTQDGVQTYSANGTNADWAKLVLLFGNWPQTEQNVTVMLRWMRQENGPQDWWNRNNPLNNGYGSGGGAGLGSYPDLVTAAKYAAENLQRGYPDVVAGLAAGTSADATAQAIWASPWSTSHYGNGSHWSTAPVDIVKAPAGDW